MFWVSFGVCGVSFGVCGVSFGVCGSLLQGYLDMFCRLQQSRLVYSGLFWYIHVSFGVCGSLLQGYLDMFRMR